MLDLLGSLRGRAVCLRLACLNDDAVEQPQVLDELVDGAVRPAVEQARGASGAVLCCKHPPYTSYLPYHPQPFSYRRAAFFTLGVFWLFLPFSGFRLVFALASA